MRFPKQKEILLNLIFLDLIDGFFFFLFFVYIFCFHLNDIRQK